MLKIAIIALSLGCLAPSFVAAQVFGSDSGTASFTSKVPLHTFTGTSNQLVGQVNFDEAIVDFYIDLTTLKSGNGKRDKDMRITLETKKYPFAEFYGKLVSDFDQGLSEPQKARVKGDFTIHGVSKEVLIDGTMQMTDEGLHVMANWQLNLEDFDIVPPSLLIVKVDEVQDISINTLLTPTEAN